MSKATNGIMIMDSILLSELTELEIDYSYSESKAFKAITVNSLIARRTVESILYVLCYTVVFVQPVGPYSFEILYN